MDDDDLIENISDPTGNNFTTFSISSNNFLDATVKKLSNDQEILMNNVSAEKFNELDKESPPVESEAIFENHFSHEVNLKINNLLIFREAVILFFIKKNFFSEQ